MASWSRRLALASLLYIAAGPSSAGEPDFAHAVVPILRQHCAECHTGDKKKGGFSMNTRADLLAGGESGPAIVAGKGAESALVKRVLLKEDDEEHMPPLEAKDPKRRSLTPAEAAMLRDWIDAGAKWEPGFAFKRPAYEPPLKPRRPELPPVVENRQNPIDRILDAALAKQNRPRPARVDDATFLRRASLDLVGLLPTPEDLAAFQADTAPDKRAKKIDALLGDSIGYTEHWLSFWNDLLRNDYAGTGYIDGGRKQISAWLYRSLAENKPYDRFVRELIAPTPESAGFANGIKWRGTVSAGQAVPVQFAQSVGQTLLGLNLKCASCHDSFVDRWKLDEAYALAAVFSKDPLEIHRCDKPTGRKASPGWLFPELGTIDGATPQPQRLEQLAKLMTHPENGRFTRTVVNRLWQRLMGRGIVHPVDAMQSEPWNADLLDYLAVHLADNGFDLKKTLALISTSEAYQSASELRKPDEDEKAYTYAGPRARRMSAEQFTDAVWQITGTAPTKHDAPIVRVAPDPTAGAAVKLSAEWIGPVTAPTPKTATLRGTIELADVPEVAGGVAASNGGIIVYANGKKIAETEKGDAPALLVLDGAFKKGANEIFIVAKNEEAAPAAFLQAELKMKKGDAIVLASDKAWQWSTAVPDKGAYKTPPTDWKPVTAAATPAFPPPDESVLRASIARATFRTKRMVRASLMKSDLLMRTLGRPNREQIVSMRPSDLSTLEAMDLNNGSLLAGRIEAGAKKLVAAPGVTSDALAKRLFVEALGRAPSADELAAAREMVGEKPTAQSVEDLLWAVLMLPEFQIVR